MFKYYFYININSLIGKATSLRSKSISPFLGSSPFKYNLIFGITIAKEAADENENED